MNTTLRYKIEAPSNIALLKYWGKRDAINQWPANDSFSMTLKNARTATSAAVIQNPADLITWRGERLEHDHPAAKRIVHHLDRLRAVLCIDSRLEIDTVNTFPAACGIASSASGFAALTTAALAAWTGGQSLSDLEQLGFSRGQLALLARLGSGSACRSLWGGFVQWRAGSAPESQTVEQLFDENHWPLVDIIALVSDSEKKISSRLGHQAAFTSPFMEPRLAVLPERMKNMIAAVASRNLEALGILMEAEALEMHSVMMSSTPAANYLLPETTALLSWIRKRRYFGDFPAYFTIDAGPNVHLLCEPKDVPKIMRALSDDWPGLKLFQDETGDGPVFTSESSPRKPIASLGSLRSVEVSP